MATNHLVCCDRLDESRYRHKCVCPSATFDCESSEQDAEICGHSEYTGDGIVASEPPKKYKIETETLFGQVHNRYQCCSGTRQINTHETTTVPRISTITFDPDISCTVPTGGLSNGNIHTTNTTCASVETESDRLLTTICAGLPFGTTTSTVSSTTQIDSECNFTDNFFGGSDCAGQVERTIFGERSEILTSEDTEIDALDRETPVVGTSCSSTWQVRSTGFTWIKRTSGYTIECDDLVIGYEYEVTPAIRKRTVVIGSFGAWEDVVVIPVVFTATAKTETIDDGGDPIDLNFIQGFEYEITGVNIEKTA